MQVSYSTGQQQAVAAEVKEITTYMWPGFLGEFDHSTLVFTTWELAGPTLWIPRPDIVTPPLECIGVCTTKTRTWTLPSSPSSLSTQEQQEQWIQQGQVSRRLVQVPAGP